MSDLIGLIIGLVVIIFVIYLLIMAAMYVLFAVGSVGAIFGGAICIKNYAFAFKDNLGILKK